MSPFPTRGLTDTIDAVGGKGHHPSNLLDFQLLARPAQAVAESTDRWHDRPERAACAHAAGPGASTTPPATRTTLGSAGRRSRRVELGLNQTLRVVAVRLVELPDSAEIDTGGRCLLELFARASCKTHYCQNHDEPHRPIL